jgi:hypothetical protein
VARGPVTVSGRLVRKHRLATSFVSGLVHSDDTPEGHHVRKELQPPGQPSAVLLNSTTRPRGAGIEPR